MGCLVHSGTREDLLIGSLQRQIPHLGQASWMHIYLYALPGDSSDSLDSKKADLRDITLGGKV